MTSLSEKSLPYSAAVSFRSSSRPLPDPRFFCRDSGQLPPSSTENEEPVKNFAESILPAPQIQGFRELQKTRVLTEKITGKIKEPMDRRK
jgi:hypothetical protein